MSTEPQQVVEMSSVEEVLDTRTPEEIEQELIKKHEEQALNSVNRMSPADISAVFFQNYYPMFKQALSTLSNKEARRVIDALVQWPLEDANPLFKTKEAQTVFALGIRLIDAKTIMRDTVELEQMQQAQEKELDKTQESGDNISVTDSQFVKGDNADNLIKENK